MNRSNQDSNLGRREFLQVTAMAGCTILIPSAYGNPIDGMKLEVAETIGGLGTEPGTAPIAGASWFTAKAEGDGFAYRFPAGYLSKARFLTADMLLDGNNLLAFSIALQEGENGPTFRLVFGGLPQCSFRVRLPLALVDQNRWRIEREAAFLKPMCAGDRVNLALVDRMRLTILHKRPGPVRWCMTPLLAAPGEVERISAPILPKGKLLDELGQSTLHQWPEKTRNVDELKQRIQSQWENGSKQTWPQEFTRWGGWKSKKLTEGQGFFRTHNDGKRWWLVDPDGYAFWSAGLDCVRVDTEARFDGLESALTWAPDPNKEFHDMYGTGKMIRVEGKFINYLAANMIRALGPDGWRNKWAKIALAEMKRLRFNTVANWSEWEYAKQASFPYVRPMDFKVKRSTWVYRDFPDVFHPEFEADAADFASLLSSTVNDPAFIGYFLMNEPSWGFSSELPAVGMLYVTASCHTRTELSRFLRKKYSSDGALAAAWKMAATLAKVESGKWQGVFTQEAQEDLREFTVQMVERYFKVISTACRKVDPNHLNLGMRWAGIPPVWAVRGMKFFDVFSLNNYRPKLARAEAEKIHEMLKMPVMVGEYHFGALDVGLPASGIGHLKNQTDRAKAYRIYLEDAAADSYCVGVHWFTLYDQSALGRFDGECYNIGFLDVCNRPYDEMGKAAIASHESMYQVADGQTAPFSDAPEYLPLLYL
ncbi:MAG TPA: hypothetical protein VMW38_28250 [Terriglobia bacterium]|nr:hypothetical protein [Terriglobia bacterium]